MANSRIPHEYIERIMKSNDVSPQMRVLHWYYRNMFGWSKNFKEGSFTVKSFSKVAEKIGIDKSRLNRVLISLSKQGFFSIDFKKKTFYLSNQKVVNFSNKSGEEKLSKRTTKSCQKEQQKVVKNDNTSCQKEQLLSPQSIDNTGADKPLKHSLKQDLKNNTLNQEENEFEIYDPSFDILRLQNYSKGTGFEHLNWNQLSDWLIKDKCAYVQCYQVLKNLMIAYGEHGKKIHNVDGLYFSSLQTHINGNNKNPKSYGIT